MSTLYCIGFGWHFRLLQINDLNLYSHFSRVFFNKLCYDKKLHKRKNGKIDSIEETQKEKANWAGWWCL